MRRQVAVLVVAVAALVGLGGCVFVVPGHGRGRHCEVAVSHSCR